MNIKIKIIKKEQKKLYTYEFLGFKMVSEDEFENALSVRSYTPTKDRKQLETLNAFIKG